MRRIIPPIFYLTMTSPIPLYRCADLRRIEAAAADQPLMQRAGRAAAELARDLCGGKGPVLVLAGPGNNGGDAFEMARLLREWLPEAEVQTVFAGTPAKLPKDAAAAFQRFVAARGAWLTAIPENPGWRLIVDGLFGIGLAREIAEPWATLVRSANALAVRDACPLLALDCPSGLDADTGRQHGLSIRASHTISFIGGKPGLFTADGPDCGGQVSIAPLGLDAATICPPDAFTVSRALFAGQIRARLRNTHKGSFGSAGVLGGASGMVGAALLAARAALRLGAGRVYLGLLDENAPSVDMVQPELMLRTAATLFTAPLNALACGPGMGDASVAADLLRTACQTDLPLLLDADALNLLAADGDLQRRVSQRHAATLLTPHPAEAARLLGGDVSSVQSDRLRTARELAARFRSVVALKGCGTVVADTDGAGFINTSGNPGLAAAGSGDVLTGIVTALLAQGWPARAALLAGVHLHGLAADHLVEQGVGPIGLTAGEFIDSARCCFNAWTAWTHRQ